MLSGALFTAGAAAVNDLATDRLAVCGDAATKSTP